MVFFFGCSAPVIPPEVKKADVQEHDLWRAGAEELAPEEFNNYKTALRLGKDLLIHENAKFLWFRNYREVGKQFATVLAQGEKLRLEIEKRRGLIRNRVTGLRQDVSGRIESLRRLTDLVNEGRYSRRHLTKAGILLGESDALIKAGRLLAAEQKLESASLLCKDALKPMGPILDRYSDRATIEKWKRWVEETERESGRSGGYAIIVSKIDRTLTLYKDGRPHQTFSIGIGFNGSKDKLHAGDRATPEGRYRIIKKLWRSRYYKALLIDYPNDEDRRQYAIARKNGIIPSGVGIGGLIEIHGGGKEGMTYGCVALENRDMERLFDTVSVGTPVTIVGAMSYENNITKGLRPLSSSEGEAQGAAGAKKL